MSTLRYAMPVAALVLVVGACSATPAASGGPATNAPNPSSAANPTAPMPTPGPTAAAPTETPASPASLGGTWDLVLSNPRVISATGSYVGGTVVIDGNRSIFTEGSYRSTEPIEISGTKLLDCNERRCEIEGVALWQVHLVEGRLAIVNAGFLTPLGSFGDGGCAWEDVPDGGVMTVVSTGMVDGQDVPTVLTFSDGTASGTGAECETGSYAVAWDVTATRQ